MENFVANNSSSLPSTQQTAQSTTTAINFQLHHIGREVGTKPTNNNLSRKLT